MPSAKEIEIEALYRQYGPALLLLARAISGDRERAQDAIHDVFLRLIKDDRLHQATNKKAYLFACVRNAVLNGVKLQDRHQALEAEADALWFDPPNRDYAGEQKLRSVLSTLPEDQREVVVLHVWGELTFSEIGTLLGTSPNTAASRYRYAISKMRDSLFPKEDPCANPR